MFEEGKGNERLARILASENVTALQTKAPQISATPISPPLQINQWSEISITVALGGRVSVRINGSSVAAEVVDPTWPASTATRIFVGINFVETPSGEVRVHSDDVRLTVP